MSVNRIIYLLKNNVYIKKMIKFYFCIFFHIDPRYNTYLYHRTFSNFSFKCFPFSKKILLDQIKHMKTFTIMSSILKIFIHVQQVGLNM